MAYAQDYVIIVNEFKLQSRNYVLFWTNIFRKGIKSRTPTAMG